MSWSWLDILWHVLAYPIYQIIGTLRHEGCHAIVARSFGASILEFRFLPHRRDGRWYWGYVKYEGSDLDRDQIEVVKKAPYVLDIALVLAWFLVDRLREFESFHWWAFATVMLLVSPVVDFVYNLFKALVWHRGDLVDE